MKRVLLISSNTERFPYPVPPIGICQVASSIEKEYQVKVIDGLVVDAKGIADTIGEFKPDYIGIGVRNVDNMVMHAPKTYIEEIKQQFIVPVRENSDAPIILGGSGFSIFPGQMMDYLGADYGLIGEGDEVFIELLRCLDKSADISALPMVLDNKRKTSTYNPGFKSNPNLLSGFSGIYRHISFEPYRQRGAYPIQTKKGCSHNCIYCVYPLIEGSCFRYKSSGSVVDEIVDAMEHLGDVTFEFVDSTFNDPRGHAESICTEVIRRGIKPKLRTMGINPANASAELFDLMLKAGFTQIDSTPDSAAPAMLLKLGKNFTLQQLQTTANLLKLADIPTMWFFIFGGPGETNDTITQTYDFIDKYINSKDLVHITTGPRIYPGTELHRIAIAEKLISADDPLLNPVFYISPSIKLEDLEGTLAEFNSTRYNCLPGSESTPSAEMIANAMELRAELKLEEPAFRTLLRIRERMFKDKNNKV